MVGAKRRHLKRQGKNFQAAANSDPDAAVDRLGKCPVAGEMRQVMQDEVHRRLARLLIHSRGAYGVEFARKRAVAWRLMGDDAEFRDWAQVRRDAELLLKELEAGDIPSELFADP